MNRVKSALLATGLTLVLAFTFGCFNKNATSSAEVSSGSGQAGPYQEIQEIAKRNQASSEGSQSLDDKMILECQQKYIEDFCGLGIGIADSPDAAVELAEAEAMGNLAARIGVDISSDLERDRVVDLNKKANQDAFSILKLYLEKRNISNTVIRDARTEFNEQKGLYFKYRSISANKKEVYKKIGEDLASQKILQDTDDAREFGQKVRDYLSKK